MLYIVCSQITNRLKYVGDVIFDQFLNIPYQFITYTNYHPNAANYVIEYGNDSLISQPKISIPDVGLLFEKGIHNQDLKFHQADIPYIFSHPSTTEHILDFDIFSAIFYLLTEYEKYEISHLDIHGRYIRNEYPSHRLQLHKFPLVHLYIEYLCKALQKKWPNIELNKKTHFDYEITIDVDNPWKYLNKGDFYLIGGGIKQLMKGDLKGLAERVKAFYTGDDPNFTFEQIYDLCPPEKTTFFFLISKKSSYDSRFNLDSKPYQKLISEIRDRGYAIGIHPSYDSFLSKNVICEEKEALEQCLNIPINRSRQHFLKYRLPQTFQYLEAVGIRHEYTICDFQQGGFPTGMARPYLWYDLKEERTSQLWIHPTIIMDWSLLQYMGLSQEQAIEEVQTWVEACKRYGGIFNLLFHNDALSESHPWVGWQQTIVKIINTLKANS